MAHPNARAAHRLEHPRAALHELAVDARLGDRREDLPRSGRGGGRDRGVHDLAVAVCQHGARQRQVGVARVDRRADAHLRQLGARDLLDRHHVAGALRLRHQRAELAQVDLDPVVVLAALLRADVGEVLLALLAAEPVARRVVRREDRRGCAELGDHVRDRAALGHAQVRGARPGELEDLVRAAAHPALAEQLEDDVLGLRPGTVERPLQPHLDHLGAADLVRVTGHRHSHVEPAGADGDHPERPARGGVRVRAHQDPARLGVALDVHVVADAVARARVVDPELARHRLEHAVVVGVLEVELDDVVVDVLHRAVHPHALCVELLELHAGHRPGGVLQQRLVHAQADRRAGFQLAVDQVLLEDLPGQVLGHQQRV